MKTLLAAAIAVGLTAGLASAQTFSPDPPRGTPAPFGAPAGLSITQADVPLVISSPGRYVVRDNLVQASDAEPIIEVTADDVTILLNGFTLSGTGTGTRAAIEHTGVDGRGLVVVNGTIVGMGGGGIDAGEIDASRVEDVVVRGFGVPGAIVLDNEATISECKVSEPAFGADAITVGNQGRIERCIVDGFDADASASSGAIGILTGEASLVTASHVNRVATVGIRIGEHSIVQDSVVSRTGGSGVIGPTYATIRNCITRFVGSDGFSASTSSHIIDCTSVAATRAGFLLIGSANISRCTSDDAGADGFWIQYDSVLTDCRSRGANGAGFSLLAPAAGSELIRCRADDSGGAGFAGPEDTTVDGCVARNSGGGGFLLGDESSARNCVADASSGPAGFQLGEWSTITSCSSRGPVDFGIQMGIFGAVRGCDVSSAQVAGIDVGAYSSIERSNASSNVLGIRTATQVSVNECTATANDTGVFLGTDARLVMSAINSNTIGVDGRGSVRTITESCSLSINGTAFVLEVGNTSAEHTIIAARIKGATGFGILSGPDDHEVNRVEKAAHEIHEYEDFATTYLW